jgi:hypothetical protein
VNVVEENADNLGRWFARYAEDGSEAFSARLLNDTSELGVAWTSNMHQLVGSIAETQCLIAMPLMRISGTASDGIERMIKSGRLNTKLYIRHLARRLGGKWQLEVVRRAQIDNEIWDIIATRIGG